MTNRIALREESFSELIRSGGFYADKTAWLRPLFESPSRIQILARSKGFGKSAFLAMACAFLQVEPARSPDVGCPGDLFPGLEISKDPVFCADFMGRVPVLALNFAGMAGLSFEEAFSNFGIGFAKMAARFGFLAASSRLDAQDKEDLRLLLDEAFMKEPTNAVFVSNAIGLLGSILEKHFGTPPVLLVDEFDAPLASASGAGYREALRGFYASLLDPLAPGPGGHCPFRKAVFAGRLPAPGDIFPFAVSPVDVSTPLSEDDPFAGALGFTEGETERLLASFGLESRLDLVRERAGGYQMDELRLFCPGDVLSFCAESQRKKEPPASDSQRFPPGMSGSDVLDDFLASIKAEDAKRLQSLLAGGGICVRASSRATAVDLKRRSSEAFWSFLLFAGFLTVAKHSARGTYLRIPNRAVRDEFAACVRRRFGPGNAVFVRQGCEFASAACAGDPDAMSAALNEALYNYVPADGAADDSCAFCRGLLLSLVSASGSQMQTEAHEDGSGAGGAPGSILFETSRTPHALAGIGLGLAMQPTDLKATASEALSKIRAQAKDGRNKCRGRSPMRSYGIAFSGRSCLVEGGLQG